MICSTDSPIKTTISGWIIKTISASDEDLDQELLYSLNDTFGDMFSVNKEGGVVLMRELDREDTDRYVVEVVSVGNFTTYC